MRRRARRAISAEATAVDPLVGQCREFVESLGLPPATSVRDLVPFVEAKIGEPIHIAPHEKTDGSLPCGMVVRRGEGNYIGYDPETSPAHRDHIIAHELAHLLLGHRGAAPAEDFDLDLLDDDLLVTVLGRTEYDEDPERWAEAVGSLLQAHVLTSRPTSNSESANRIARTLMRRDA
ncbi:ImmA/IrrE family metallo-endopeptidase [Streptomyces sp. NPDC056399]|uniref:ImmA/IrrE family metallo-endopeptidase n=1 Tax=Streptomyces sp. NPDC056399 TaxID=3345807 RepID=UPI0035D8353B